jgi:hypothetical protein
MEVIRKLRIDFCVIYCFAELWISMILVQVATRPIMADESPFGISDG